MGKKTNYRVWKVSQPHGFVSVNYLYLQFEKIIKKQKRCLPCFWKFRTVEYSEWYYISKPNENSGICTTLYFPINPNLYIRCSSENENEKNELVKFVMKYPNVYTYFFEFAVI